MRGTERRHGWLAGLALAVMSAVLFRRVLFGGEVLFGRDMAPFFYPMKHYLAESVRSGVIPLWNPWILNGEPFFASLQPGLLYPGSLLLYLIPLPFSFNLLHVIHYPVAGVGMYLLLRSWRQPTVAALFGGLAFMAGGYLLSIGNFTNNLQTVALLPWVFWSWSRLLSAGGSGRALIFCGFCAVAFLGGEPQMLLMGLGLLLLHGLLDVEGTATMGWPRQIAVFAATGMLAIALVGVQLLPFIEYLGESVRVLQFDYEFAAGNSLAPVSLSQLLVPPVLGGGPFDFSTRNLASPGVPWLLSLYPGVLVLSFAALGLARPKSRRWLWFWGGVSLLGLLLALGRFLPLHRILYALVPPVRLVRYPEKFYFLTAFGLSVISAHGIRCWLDSTPVRSARVASVSLGTALLLSGGLAIALAASGSLLSGWCESLLAGGRLCGDPTAAQPLYAVRLGLVAAVAASALAAMWLARRRAIGAGAAAAALVILLAIDLGAAGRHVNPSVPATLYRSSPWADRILDARGATDETFRYRGTPLSAQMGDAVVVRGAEDLANLYLWHELMGPNQGQVFGHLSQDGLQGVELLDVAEMIDLALGSPPPEALQLLRSHSVRYYADPTVPPTGAPGLSLLARHPELPAMIFEVSDPRPRAYLVSEYVVRTEPRAALGATMAPSFPLDRSVVLDRPPPDPPRPGASGHIVRASYRPNRVALNVETDGASLLVLTDRHYPGWKATVNGRPVAIHRAAGYLRAVPVPAGQSEVVFRFAPRSVRYGGLISLAGVIACLVLMARGRRTGSTTP